jgi:hypothetical protein
MDIYLSESQYGGTSNSTAILLQDSNRKFIDTARAQLSAQVDTSGGMSTILRGPGGTIYFVFESQSRGGRANLSLSRFMPK